MLGAAFGFLGSLVPQLFKMFQDSKDKAHELAVMQLQLEQAKQGHSDRMDEIKVNADAADTQEQSKILEKIYDTFYVGIKWIDGLNASVRPVIAYCYFLLYAAIKIMVFYWPNSAVTLLWTEDDQAIFAAILTFYYGQRAMGKMGKK